MLEELFQVAVAVFKNEVEFLVPGDYLFQVDDVGVFEDLQQGDFPHCSGRYAFVLMIQSDLFNSDYLIGFLITCLIHHPVGSLTNFVDALELVFGGG